jgi:putative redox protein
MRMYAERKGWPLEGVVVELHHDRVHAADSRDSESETRLVDLITKRISLTGPLDEAQRHRLVEIAGRCPVHRTLMNEIRIEQHLVLDRG